MDAKTTAQAAIPEMTITRKVSIIDALVVLQGTRKDGKGTYKHLVVAKDSEWDAGLIDALIERGVKVVTIGDKAPSGATKTEVQL